MLTAMFWVIEGIIITVALLPVIRFLVYQWKGRRQEFINRLDGNPLIFYMSRFHGESPDSQDAVNRFSALYDEIIGRRLYYAPIALLFLTVAVEGGLVAQTAIRAGYENYLLFYKDWAAAESAARASIPLSVADVDFIFQPFPPLALSLATLAAIAGAYLNAVGVVIQGYRARTLVPSELLWGSFRLLIAVPLGLSFAQMANASVGAFVGFALGAFPMETINRLLRRLMSKQLDVTPAETADQLVRLQGVTPDIAALLADEGAFTIAQLANTDPVALAIRSGLSFDYLLNLVAQSQAWCYMGETVAALAPHGLGEARSIARLLDQLNRDPGDKEALGVLAAASAATKLDPSELTFQFRAIAADNYTRFLLAISQVRESPTAAVPKAETIKIDQSKTIIMTAPPRETTVTAAAEPPIETTNPALNVTAPQPQ